MKTILLLKTLENYPVFTESDVAKLENKNQPYARTLLYRLQKKGYIKRIERGKYTCHNDLMIVASYILTPSYISLWSAFKYYNLTQQQPQTISIISKKPHKDIIINNTKIKFNVTKHFFGYKKERYRDFDIFVAEKEKAIIDALLFKMPIQDIAESIIDESINYKKLVAYAKKTENHSLIKRLGYILQNKKGGSYGLKAFDNNYILLDYFHKKIGKKNKEWKLIVNNKL